MQMIETNDSNKTNLVSAPTRDNGRDVLALETSDHLKTLARTVAEKTNQVTVWLGFNIRSALIE